MPLPCLVVSSCTEGQHARPLNCSISVRRKDGSIAETEARTRDVRTRQPLFVADTSAGPSACASAAMTKHTKLKGAAVFFMMDLSFLGLLLLLFGLRMMPIRWPLVSITAADEQTSHPAPSRSSHSANDRARWRKPGGSRSHASGRYPVSLEDWDTGRAARL